MPGVAGRNGNAVGVVPRSLLVNEPVVDLKLNPRSREHVQEWHAFELRPREELQTHRARARVHQVGGVRERVGERRVASEPRARLPHERARQIVVRAIGRAPGYRVRRRRRLRFRMRRLFGVVKILLAQLVARLEQLWPADGRRKLEPLAIANLVEDHGGHSCW